MVTLNSCFYKITRTANSDYTIHLEDNDSIVIEHFKDYNLVTFYEDTSKYEHMIQIEYPENDWTKREMLEFDTNEYIDRLIRCYEVSYY